MSLENNLYTDNFAIKYNEGDVSLQRYILIYEIKNSDEFHIVKDEDDITQLAFKYYGDPTQWFHIADANKLLNPFELVTGSSLHIPNIEELNFNNRLTL